MSEPGEVSAAVRDSLIREILEAICERDGVSLDSAAEPGTPARNYELAMRLGIGHVFGIPRRDSSDAQPG